MNKKIHKILIMHHIFLFLGKKEALLIPVAWKMAQCCDQGGSKRIIRMFAIQFDLQIKDCETRFHNPQIKYQIDATILVYNCICNIIYL